jgi:hypothetical protein
MIRTSESVRNDTEKVRKTYKVITSFSWTSAFNDLKSSRCKEWENKELDFLETFKFVSFALM